MPKIFMAGTLVLALLAVPVLLPQPAAAQIATDSSASSPSIAQLWEIVRVLQAQLSALLAQFQQLQQNQWPKPIPIPDPYKPIISPVEPSITVISPNGGESYKIGDTVNITWKTSNIPSNYYASAILVDENGNNNYGSISDNKVIESVGTGSYQWKVGNNVGNLAMTPGKYKIRISVDGGKYFTDIHDYSDNYFTISSSNGSVTNKPPVITGLSAPSNLKVGEKGTWVVRAYDPEGGPLSYSVSWGEPRLLALGVPPPPDFSQSSTFTYAYNTPGAYRVTITVKDSAGQSAQTSATVNVEAIINPVEPSITVISPNGGETLKVGQTHRIMWTYNAIPNSMFDSSVVINLIGSSYGPKIGFAKLAGGYFDWVVGETFGEQVPLSANPFRIKICLENGVCDQSDSTFTIANPEARASLQVTVLNGDVRCFTYPCEVPLLTSTVQLYNAVTGAFIGSQSTAKGYALFSNLDPGIYRAAASDPGFNVKNEAKIELKSGQTGSLKITLQNYTTTLQKTVTAADRELAAVLQSLQGILNNLSGSLSR